MTNNDPNTGTPPSVQPKLKPKRIRKPQAPRPKAKPKAAAPDCENCPFRKQALENAEKAKSGQPTSGTPKPRLIDEIRRLDIPARCKAELALLCVRAKDLGLKVLRFIRRHRHIAESILLGAAIGWLLCYIPIIGGFLSLVALATSVAAGMVKELREQLAALFAAEMPAHA
jgi:hypothetical protein